MLLEHLEKVPCPAALAASHNKAPIWGGYWGVSCSTRDLNLDLVLIVSLIGHGLRLFMVVFDHILDYVL